MFRSMFHRLRRPVIHLLVAAQLLLSAPMVNALDLLAQGEALPCMEQMAEAAGDSDCPCCPDGTGSMAGCLSVCLAAAAVAPDVHASTAPTRHIEACVTAVTAVTSLGEPPLKPPPIV
jgi:hypothetical protein